jgi:oligosaccharide translocation protein RFT1
LQDVLRFYGILGIVACAIGPSAAPVLLRFVAGSRWSDTDASSVLVSYCYYIPLLAINGVTEAFVTAVAPVTTLHQQSVLMFVWFAAFAGSSYVFVSVLGLGGSGLVYANCVNMALRIVFNTHFASRFFGQNEAVRFSPMPNLANARAAHRDIQCSAQRLEFECWRWGLVNSALEFLR